MLRLPIELDLVESRLKGLHIENTDLLDAVEDYYVHLEDIEAHEVDCYYLPVLGVYIPYYLVNQMVDRIYRTREACLSEYAGYRDCEEFIISTEWFKDLDYWAQEFIYEDFYERIISGVRDAYDRKKQ